MAEEPDVIRQQIEQTRESLTQKLETLEGQVKDTVASVTSAVETTVETVKSKVEDTVQAVTSGVEETVETVKRTFDIPYQVDRHPWAMAGGSLLVGLAAGFLVGRPRRSFVRRATWAEVPAGLASACSAPQPESYPPAGFQPAAEEHRPGLLSSLLSSFEPELEKVKQAAIGTLMAAARDYLTRTVPPPLASNVAEILDSVTRKMGGEPIHGNLFGNEHRAV
jgi:ElaB/YqjD/DUF883 family membrane-anchored ribosome-binding protein